MTARWPDPDRAIIDRHVAILDLHSMKAEPVIGRSCMASRMWPNVTMHSVRKC